MTSTILEEDLFFIHSRVSGRGRWAGAEILITGCAGFLGFYFLNYFLRYGDVLKIKRVIGLDSFALGRPAWLESLAQRYCKLLDLREFDVSRGDLPKSLAGCQPRYIIHAASIASPSFYRKFPLETIDANVWGLRGLLDYARFSQHVSGFLFFSSSEIYGDPRADAIPTNEAYRGNVACVGPRACYDESKRFGETLCWVYAQQTSLPIVVARPFNNFGPGMSTSDQRLPADFANCIVNNRDLVIFSDGTPTRTFCYVADAIVGYLMCLTHGRYDHFNIGCHAPEISVAKFAEIFRNYGAKIFGYTGSIRFEVSSDKEYLVDNPNRRCPDISKATDLLGYRPEVNVEAGVGRYLTFLKESLYL